MGEVPVEESAYDDNAPRSAINYSVGTNVMRNKRMKVLGGPMNQEELRMNKHLLKEIHRLKRKGDDMTSPQLYSN